MVGQNRMVKVSTVEAIMVRTNTEYLLKVAERNGAGLKQLIKLIVIN